MLSTEKKKEALHDLLAMLDEMDREAMRPKKKESESARPEKIAEKNSDKKKDEDDEELAKHYESILKKG
jgi:hypothetical protein